MNKVIVLIVEVDIYVFSSISKMKDFLLKNEDFMFTEDSYNRLIEDHGVETPYCFFVYGEFLIDGAV